MAINCPKMQGKLVRMPFFTWHGSDTVRFVIPCMGAQFNKKYFEGLGVTNNTDSNGWNDGNDPMEKKWLGR